MAFVAVWCLPSKQGNLFKASWKFTRYHSIIRGFSVEVYEVSMPA